MNLKEYTSKAITTATHNTYEKSMSCFLFGILGEWAELQEKIEDGCSEEDIKKELGDYFWYVVNYSNKIGVVPVKVYFNLYSYNPWYVIAKFQEYNKKLYRDKDWVIDDETKLYLSEQLNILYSMGVHMCENYKFNLSDIFSLNIEKLFSRKDRGVINGSGDER